MTPKVKYTAKEGPVVREGSWNMQGIKVSTGAKLRNWSYMIIDMGDMQVALNDRETLEYTIGRFRFALQEVGMDASPRMPGPWIYVDGPDDLKIENAFEIATQGPSHTHTCYSPIGKHVLVQSSEATWRFRTWRPYSLRGWRDIYQSTTTDLCKYRS